MKRLFKNTLLIKKDEAPTTSPSGMSIPIDKDMLPKATVIIVADNIPEDMIKKGDNIYYVEGRETGKCKYEGTDHYVISLDNAIGII